MTLRASKLKEDKRSLQLAELRRLFELQSDFCDIVLELKDVGVVDRDVVCFFVCCEADGVKLENCPSYIREWMERETD
jgi:hypothetical protein